MRQYGPPYLKGKFLLNTNTGEIHDLSKEKEGCKIQSMSPEHAQFFENLDRAFQYGHLYTDKVCNGCAHCLSEYDIG